MRIILHLAIALCLAVAVGVTGAHAQSPPAGDTGAPPANRAGSASSSSGSANSGIGLGAEATLTGLAGAAFIYDAGLWHLDVIAGMEDQDRGSDPELFVAGRFFWVLHTGTRSDFSLGGGVGVSTNDDDTDIHLEGAAQLRVFLTDNVAANGSLGIGLVVGDNDRTRIGGQLLGAAGIAYFFY